MNNALSEALLAFRCNKDTDIENFLHTKAVEYEARKICTVYLILNEEELVVKKFKIEAYFTLSHKVINFTPEISKTTRKKICGNKFSDESHFVLIGQLGKYIEKLEDDTYKTSQLTCKDILDRAFEIIQKANDLIACKWVLVECSDNEKVHSVYIDYCFEFLQFDTRHYQFIRQV